MPGHVLQWFVTKRIAALAIGFLIISDFNAILVSVAILLLRLVLETVCRNIVIARRSIYPGQRDMIICVKISSLQRTIIMETRQLVLAKREQFFMRRSPVPPTPSPQASIGSSSPSSYVIGSWLLSPVVAQSHKWRALVPPVQLLR